MASVSKKTWKGKDGKSHETWVVRYYDNAAGKRRSKAFVQKKLADKYRLKIENDLAAGVHVAASETPTVREAAEQYIRHSEDRLRDGRIGRGQYKIVRQGADGSIIPLVGAMKMTDLSSVVVEKFYGDMCRGGNLSPKTAKGRVHLLGQIERYCLRRGEIKTAVVGQALKDLANIPMPRIRTFGLEELRKLLEAVSAKGYRRKQRSHAMLNCMVNIAAFCGLRFGELTGLKLENVDVDARVIRVRNSLTEFNELKGPKTKAGIRDVPMPTHVVKLLEDWIATHFVVNERGLTFTSQAGFAISSGNFHRDLWQRLVRDAGLAGDRTLRFHALRHFCASWMISNGMPVTDVAKLLGHSHFDKTLQVYSHSLMDVVQQHDAIERMSARLRVREAPAALMDPSRTHEAVTI